MEKKQSNYVRFPKTVVAKSSEDVSSGYAEISACITAAAGSREKTVITIECYPGVDQQELLEGIRGLGFVQIIHSDDLAFEPQKIDTLLEQDMTDDPVFAVMTVRRMEDYFYSEKIAAARALADEARQGLVLIYGVGASLVHPGDIQILADITRWEIQLRYRRGMDNWRTAQSGLPKLKKYKRGYFAEWRWADQIKDRLLHTLDFYLDMSTQGAPAMVRGDSYRHGLELLAGMPFRMVPYFDPGVWGGDWMRTHFDLPENGSNYAWSFDGVPEENSLLLDYGGKVIQTAAINLVLFRPRQLLGEGVHARFGKEFPIRFDMLDTVHGQNLSLQVHPLTEYIQNWFNMTYTQDESYYILDAEGDSCVYLGVKSSADPSSAAKDLRAAQQGEISFPAEQYVNRIPVKKHDHVLIPAGTIHCSGAGTMVLEISATPYIFTFKLWDWGRVDLDGKPRPIHVEHGLANIQWDRDTQWVRNHLINAVTTVYKDEQTLVERTGLHKREFIDTHRVTTTGRVKIRRNGSVHVMNLVDGRQAWLVSAGDAFPPFPLHYAETCIVHEAAGEYYISSDGGEQIMVIVASVRI